MARDASMHFRFKAKYGANKEPLHPAKQKQQNKQKAQQIWLQSKCILHRVMLEELAGSRKASIPFAQVLPAAPAMPSSGSSCCSFLLQAEYCMWKVSANMFKPFLRATLRKESVPVISYYYFLSCEFWMALRFPPQWPGVQLRIQNCPFCHPMEIYSWIILKPLT